jgi:hypothetical protein
MKKSKITLLSLIGVFIFHLLTFVIPHPIIWPVNENILTNSRSVTTFESFNEIDATNGTTLLISRGSKNELKVDAFGGSDCFVADSHNKYANLYCKIAKYTIEYDQSKDVPSLLLKSNIPKVTIQYNRIKNLDLRPNRSTCIIQKLDSLNRLEILGSQNSIVELKDCVIDTLIIDGQTKLIRDKASRVNLIKVNPDYSPKTIFLNDKK